MFISSKQSSIILLLALFISVAIAIANGKVSTKIVLKDEETDKNMKNNETAAQTSARDDRLVIKDGKVVDDKKPEKNEADNDDKNEKSEKKGNPEVGGSEGRDTKQSCIFDDGRIIENGSAERNATQLEMAQLREYIRSMRTYQEQLSKKFAYRMMAQVATKIQGTIIGNPKSLRPKLAIAKEMIAFDEKPPKPPCLCKGNCDTLMIANRGNV